MEIIVPIVALVLIIGLLSKLCKDLLIIISNNNSRGVGLVDWAVITGILIIIFMFLSMLLYGGLA